MKTEYQKPKIDTVAVATMSIMASTNVMLDANGSHPERDAQFAASRQGSDWQEE